LSTQAKYLTLLKTLYNPKAGDQDKAAVGRAIHQLTETEQVDFNNFQHYVGEIFLKLMEELDKGLEELAPLCPDETDPRKWDAVEWCMFYSAVSNHKFERLYVSYARQEPNLHLVWEEIEKRI
jgi:hypothetical protein